MFIKRKSLVSGNEHEREIDVTIEQLTEIVRKNGRLIQDIVPHLSADDREFLMTGITPEEWDETFKDE